jgi:argininosuccinate synthase
VVLAFAGEPSLADAIAALKRPDVDVIAVTLDFGGVDGLESVRDRALAEGARRAHVLDVRDEFAQQYLLPALKAGVLGDRAAARKALVRAIVARKLVDIAQIEHASSVAHLSTTPDAGQAMERAVRSIDPTLSVVAAGSSTPSRAEGSASAQGHAARPQSPREAAYVELTFQAGSPTAINGVAMSLVELRSSLDVMARRHDVGDSDGLLHTALDALRRRIMPLEDQPFFATVAAEYERVLQAGSWFTAARTALDAYVDTVHGEATGATALKLCAGALEIVPTTATVTAA